MAQEKKQKRECELVLSIQQPLYMVDTLSLSKLWLKKIKQKKVMHALAVFGKCIASAPLGSVLVLVWHCSRDEYGLKKVAPLIPRMAAMVVTVTN